MTAFPSPYGELHFSILHIKNIIHFKIVSVPLRGTTFLNILKRCSPSKKQNSFRPLTGNYISQLMKVYFNETNGNKFPSPYGELHFSIPFFCFFRPGYLRFRPLTGNYISQLKGVSLMIDVRWFPSPYGELHFSIVSYFNGMVNGLLGFRPLTGNYISQYYDKSIEWDLN